MAYDPTTDDPSRSFHPLPPPIFTPAAAGACAWRTRTLVASTPQGLAQREEEEEEEEEESLGDRRRHSTSNRDVYGRKRDRETGSEILRRGGGGGDEGGGGWGEKERVLGVKTCPL